LANGPLAMLCICSEGGFNSLSSMPQTFGVRTVADSGGVSGYGESVNSSEECVCRCFEGGGASYDSRMERK
jgi:hypothetical protein